MPFVDAAGVSVNFPFDPYPCQVDYMQKLVTCLQNSYNGILESPTGTGKTLCLLCGSLAWLETKKAQISSHRWNMARTEEGAGALDYFADVKAKEDLEMQLDNAVGGWDGELAPPKIIFASRTHSQLTQAIQELKRTAYRHFKVCVLGSREQLCIHPQVMKEQSNVTKVHLCRAKVSARTCHFYNTVENAKGNFANQVMDIEDLVNLGKKLNCCPYYTAREMKAEADIIFMPYNYLLDVKSRKAHGVELTGKIVIFDEAHNLEKICEDSASFDWTSADVAQAMREITDLSDKLMELLKMEVDGEILADTDASITQEFSLKDLYELKAQLVKLEGLIDTIALPRSGDGLTKPGSYIFEIFEKANLTFGTKNLLIDLLDKIVGYLTSQGTSSFHSKGAGLSKYADVVKVVFSRDFTGDSGSIDRHQSLASKHYKVHIREDKDQNRKKKSGGWDAVTSNSNKPVRILSYWCFSPGHAMEELKSLGVKSIILTSGTLSPMSSFMSEMGIEFKVQLENPHVIEKHQVWIGTVGNGPDGTTLSSAYNTRFKEDYQASLGNAVVNFARVVPFGLLIFFPSYPVMNKCLENWTASNIWTRIEQHKPIFTEPRGKMEFTTAMECYYERVQNPTLNGAVFAAVCRGKVSEGLDFADNNGRAVVITGLPYPPRMDPKVVLKMQFLDEMRRQGVQCLTGQEWYKQQASRAVNQAIGRVIRHKQDYGAIILCDTRFSAADARAQLPSWIRPNVNVYKNFGSALRDMTIFFRNAEKTMPNPRPAKKKSSVCQGAYFMPTMSKTSGRSGMQNLEKASSVSVHVPSLSGRPASDELSLAKLKVAYETSAPVLSKNNTSKGLLAALSSSESQDEFKKPQQVPAKKCQGKFVSAKRILITDRGEVQTSETSQSSSQSNKQKKKIIIKSATSSDNQKDNLASAKDYIAEIKSTLSAESYKIFAQTLSAYKKTGDFTPMIASLAEIFTANPNNYHLFRKFYRFVRPPHKEEFDRLCREIIGQGCINRTELSSQKKRHMSGTLPSDIGVKKRKLQDKGDSKSTKFTIDNISGKTLSVETDQKNLDSRTHLNQGSSQFLQSPQATSLQSLSEPNTNSVSRQERNLFTSMEKRFSFMQSSKAASSTVTARGNDTDITRDDVNTCLIKKEASQASCTGKPRSDVANGTIADDQTRSNCSTVTTREDGHVIANDDNMPRIQCHKDSSDPAVINNKTNKKTASFERICEQNRELLSSDKVDPGSFSCDTTRSESSSSSNCAGNRLPLKEHLNNNPRDSGAGAPATLVKPLPDEENKPGVHQINKQPYFDVKQTGYLCCQCKKDAYIPLKAKCEHVCCMDCWKYCIRETKMCPECKQTVKRKHLSRMFFPCGPNKQV